MALGGASHDYYVTVCEVETDGFCGVVSIFEVEFSGGCRSAGHHKHPFPLPHKTPILSIS